MSTSTQTGGPEMTSTATTSAVPTHSAIPQGAAPVQVPLSAGHLAEGSGGVHGADVSSGDPLSVQSTKPGSGVSDASKRDEGAITPPIPKCHLRTLVISGQSHVFSFEPELTVGRVKELIWSSWPSEWTDPSAPPSPAFLRVLYSGRILQDDTTLASNNLPATLQPTNPAVVHISVRSFSLHGDEDPKKNGLVPSLSRRSSRRRSTAPQEDVGGCKCVIM